LKAIQVIFYTNAYRQLTYGKTINESIVLMEEIRRNELLQNIRAYVSPIVWLELFSHLADPNDTSFDNCYCGLVTSYFHCMEDENRGSYRLIADGEALLAGSLFKYSDPVTENLYQGFGRLIKEIHHNPDWKNEAKYSAYFKSVKIATDKDELNFLNSFREIAANYAVRKDGRKKMLSLLKTEQLFNAIAMYQVLKGLDIAKKDINEFTQADLNKHAEFIKNYFPAALHLGIDIIGKLIGNANFDITKNNRSNWVWDFQLLFYISKFNTNILITDDRAMLDAAKAAGLEDKVMKLADYKSYLGL
jgi:hypothetical protein